MGFGVSRLGDKTDGVHCEPTATIEASPNVFANGLAVHRRTDDIEPHCDHIREASGGSETVFVNGLNIMRITDDISCDDIMAEGSDNVIAG